MPHTHTVNTHVVYDMNTTHTKRQTKYSHSESKGGTQGHSVWHEKIMGKRSPQPGWVHLKDLWWHC